MTSLGEVAKLLKPDRLSQFPHKSAQLLEQCEAQAFLKDFFNSHEKPQYFALRQLQREWFSQSARSLLKTQVVQVPHLS
ncbi:hypothetical protein [Sulfitobacter sp. MOLA879]|uniref:hypothetical protein n=1 Tax=Sulfitobacter sp. MOLA879 TaxID=3368579 RepID=UPI0037475BDA